MSVARKLIDLADAIRAHTGESETLTLDEMAGEIGKVYAAGWARAADFYYAERVTLPARQTYIDLPVDFFPDQVYLFTTKTGARDTAATTIAQHVCFLPTVDSYCGMLAYNTTGGNTSATRRSGYYGTSSGGAHRLLSETAEGYRMSAGAADGITLHYDAGEYKVVAVKYSDKSDRDMLTEYVRALPDTAVTVYIASLMRERAFADEEWDTLIAEKPNATFVLH